MSIEIIEEDRHRRKYPDGKIMGNWGDVFVVFVFVCIFGLFCRTVYAMVTGK